MTDQDPESSVPNLTNMDTDSVGATEEVQSGTTTIAEPATTPPQSTVRKKKRGRPRLRVKNDRNIPFSVRIRRKVLEATLPDSGPGSRVPETELIQAARAWLDLEEKKGGPPAASRLAKAIGKSVAPAWLTADRFQRILEVERYRRKVLQMQSRPEIAQLVQEVIDLGLLEAHKRLVLSAGEIPSTVLYGDILHKLPKMVQDMTAGQRPVKAGDIFVSIVKEINLIQDPRTREQMRRSILGEYERAASALTVSSDAEIVDAETLVADGMVRIGPANVASSSSDRVSLGNPDELGSPDSGDNDQLWNDPASDQGLG